MQGQSLTKNSNGTDTLPVLSKRPLHQTSTKKQSNGSSNGLVLCIPFISDRVDGLIHRALQQSNINARLVNSHSAVVFETSSSKRKPKPKCTMRQCLLPNIDCTASYAVYQVEYNMCNQTYIGSTSRQLHYCAKEHLTAPEKHSPTSASGEHFQRQHGSSSPRISCTIIKHTARDELRLRISEAYQIKKCQPSLNRKQEHLGPGILGTNKNAVYTYAPQHNTVYL